MSMPLRITPRPVKKLRAAPTAKVGEHGDGERDHAAVRPLNSRNGATGLKAPTAVDAPVNHPSLNGVACASRLQLFAHPARQRALRVPHQFGRHLARDARLDALRLVHERDLFLSTSA